MTHTPPPVRGRRRSAFLVAGLVLALAALPAAGDAPKPDVTVTTVRAPGNVFGGQETEFAFRLEAANRVKGRATWRLAVGTATVTTGETDLDAGPNAPANVTFKLAVPPVKDGVILRTRLTVSAVEGGRARGTFERDVWIFPTDPFAGRTAWLKGMKLAVYDPPGATAKVLTAAKVPFEELRDVDALARRTDGVVVVGEGTSFREERGLAAALEKLAGAGVAVLCLAPAGGELVVPGLGGPAAGQHELTFRRDVVRRLDKRLDPAACPVASTLAVKPGDGGPAGTVAAGPGGWPWVEARYARGRWAVCGLAVVANWDAGPTPRFLFARMLEHLTEPESPEKEGAR